MSRHTVELDAAEPWRKSGFLCKPYAGNDREDAKRFYEQFMRALDGETYNKGEWLADIAQRNLEWIFEKRLELIKQHEKAMDVLASERGVVAADTTESLKRRRDLLSAWGQLSCAAQVRMAERVEEVCPQAVVRVAEQPEKKQRGNVAVNLDLVDDAHLERLLRDAQGRPPRES